MGDTTKISFVENVWTEITGLTLNVTYVLQNVGGQETFIKQVPAQPVATETGKVILPLKSATIIKEASKVWIRSRAGDGIAFFNAIN